MRSSTGSVPSSSTPAISSRRAGRRAGKRSRGGRRSRRRWPQGVPKFDVDALLVALLHRAERDLGEHPLTPTEERILGRLARRAFGDGDHIRIGATDRGRAGGYRSSDGYAYFREAGRVYLVHRWIHETFRGAATGLDVDHHCGIRDCILCLRTLPPWQNRGWHEP